jgi:hypothetical protein
LLVNDQSARLGDLGSNHITPRGFRIQFPKLQQSDPSAIKSAVWQYVNF